MRSPDIPGRFKPRMVRSAAEAEELCAEWIRWMGFADADVTVAGADGGLDVVGSNETGTIAAQVKFEAVSAGRPKVQALYGAGMAAGASIFAFFSSAGYTQQAEQWASGVGMALFGFALDGSIVAANEAAEHLMDG
jgi:HJR/Mrr/RecB family endonuclease